MKRLKKTKEQLNNEIRQTVDSNRKREIVRSKIFPLVQEFCKDVRYAKIFLYTASTAVDNVFNEKRNETKVNDIKERLLELFKGGTAEADEKVAEYVKLFDLLEEETVNNFQSMVRDLPDNLDRYLYVESEKTPISNIEIDKLLG